MLRHIIVALTLWIYAGSIQAEEQQWQWLTLGLNGTAYQEPVLVLLTDGQLYMQQQDLQRLRLTQASTARRNIDGQDLYSLDLLPGINYQVNSHLQQVLITAEPNAFLLHRATPAQINAIQPDLATGFFMNYDLQTQRSEGMTINSALLDTTFFRGTLNFSNNFMLSAHSEEDLLRLESTLIIDSPQQRTRFYMGDTLNHPGSWGNLMRFAGIRYGTDFSLDPRFIPFPLPSVFGQTNLPSTVDVMIDNIIQYQGNVPAGPFELNQLPVISGNGELLLHIRDVMGRTSVISQPFYISNTLLQEGLHNYSVETGFIREDYAVKNNRYGKAFIAGTYRKGLTSRLTSEIRSELQSDLFTLGLSNSYLLREYGIADTSLVASRHLGKYGFMAEQRFSRQSYGLSFGFNLSYASKSYLSLGQPDYLPRKRNDVGFSISMPVYDDSSISAGFIHRQQWHASTFNLLSVHFQRRLSDSLTFITSASHTLNQQKDYTVGITLSKYFQKRRSGQLSFVSEREKSRKQLQAQRNLPAGNGIGYQLLAEDSEQKWLNGELLMQTATGLYNVGISSVNGAQGVRLAANGSLIYIDNSIHLARKNYGSFALVKTGTKAGVTVLRENQPVTKTNSSGKALITDLMPYDENFLSIEHSDLPVNTSVSQLHMTVSPAIRAGAIADFELKTSLTAVVYLRLNDGAAVPAGAMVQVNQRQERYPVASGGKAYLEELSTYNHLSVTWNNGSCHAMFEYPGTNDLQPDLGILTCYGETP